MSSKEEIQDKKIIEEFLDEKKLDKDDVKVSMVFEVVKKVRDYINIEDEELKNGEFDDVQKGLESIEEICGGKDGVRNLLNKLHIDFERPETRKGKSKDPESKPKRSDSKEENPKEEKSKEEKPEEENKGSLGRTVGMAAINVARDGLNSDDVRELTTMGIMIGGTLACPTVVVPAALVVTGAVWLKEAALHGDTSLLNTIGKTIKMTDYFTAKAFKAFDGLAEKGSIALSRQDEKDKSDQDPDR